MIARGLGIVLAVGVLLGVAGCSATRVWPERSAEAMLAAYATSAGLKRNTVETPFGSVGYLEGGDGPQTVVLLHGLFGRKEHWIDLSRALTDGYRVIIPDLPGFGDNTVLGTGSSTYASQTQNIAMLLDALEIGRFHLAGNSMGGQISGMLARAMPDRIATVAFIGSPVGIDTPDKSVFETMVAQEGYSLVVRDMAEFDARNGLLFPRKPFVPAPIEAYWANAELAQPAANERIWTEVAGSNTTPLLQIAPDIGQPALVVWCREDRIFDFSGAQVLTDALPRCRLVALDGCGHVPSLDAPGAAGQALRSFLDAP